MTTCPHCRRNVEVPGNVLTAVIACPWCRYEFPITGNPQPPVVAPPAPFNVSAMPGSPGAQVPASPQSQHVVLHSQTTKAVSPLALVALATGGLFLGCFALVAAIPLAILGMLRLLVGGKVFATWNWKVELRQNQPGTSFPNPAGPGEIIEGKKPNTLPPLK
jgi:hypothetical protein